MKELRDVSENAMISEGSCTPLTPDLALDPKHDPGGQRLCERVGDRVLRQLGDEWRAS